MTCLPSRTVRFVGLFALIGIFVFAVSVAVCEGQPRPDALPRTFVLDPARLVKVKQRLARGDATLKPALARLRREADKALSAGPFSVVDNEAVPPSGDKHDYMSIGPYWWPDPDSPDGKPFIRRDGQVNPLYHDGDNTNSSELCNAVNTLALAAYLTGHEPYAKRAAHLLRVWFLDEATRMNPNLQFGQGIPGRCTGRGIGIIETRRFATLVDSVGLLGQSESWMADDQTKLEAWFGQYLDWLLKSKYGRAEGKTKNNHGTWYDAQIASFALFVGRDELARRVLSEVAQRRINTQIEPDGRQPHELKRTKAMGYSHMNLSGMFHLASLGERVGIDLWNHESSDGRSIRGALDWLIPFVLEEKSWPYQQIKKFRPAQSFPLLRRAAIAYDEPRYETLAGRLLGVASDDRARLLYPVRP